MPKFKYKGVGADGKSVKGEITASGRGDAIKTLRQGRIRVISIKEMGKSILDIQIGEEKVKVSDLSKATRQFSSMTSAGLPLVQCMDILSEQTENRTLAKALHAVSVDIQSGNSLADSLRKHKKIFNPLYCNMVEAGEASGNLDGVLERLSTYLEKSDQLQRKIKGALMYPAILLLVAVVVTILMLTFVIPKFAEMFTDFGGTLPLPTRITMAISDFLQAYFVYIIIAIIGIVIGIKKYYSTERGAYVIDSFMLKLPVLGDLLRKGAVSRFSQTLATLLGSGVSILQAL
ncbi:MAG: type II secretion system F family protein [Chitinivibrionales bacterium]